MFALSDLPTISRALQLWNGGDAKAAATILADAFEQSGVPFDVLLENPSTRLAVYGSLAPGELNQHILAPIAGSWLRGSVRGFLNDAGWGTSLGFRSLVWNEEGADVAVQVLESPELPLHWSSLDDFEGPEYRRILVPVRNPGGVLVANLYAANV